MNLRDKIIFTLGTGLVIFGVFTTLIYGTRVGVIVLLLILNLVLAVQVLQRNQLAKIQERTLRIITSAQKQTREIQRIASDYKARNKPEVISSKKILGVLQAQQVSMEILNEKLDRLER